MPKKKYCLWPNFEEIENVEAITSRNEAFAPVKKAFVGLKGEDVVGRVFITETKGYGGTMKITVE